MRRAMICVLALVAGFGCASDLRVYDSKGEPAKGIPVGSPVLVKITTTTRYTVNPSEKQYSGYCTDDVAEAYQALPLGEIYFVSLDPAPLGKSEFSLDLYDSGLVKTVKLNSDPRIAENIEATSKLIGSIAEVAKTAGMAVARDADPTAQQKKSRYCIKQSELRRIERVTLP